MFGLCEGSSCSLTNTRFSSAILLAWPLRQIISCNFCICKYSGRVCPIADPLLGFIFKASIETPQEYNKIGDFQTASQGRLNRFLPRSICRQGYSRPSWLDFISVQWWCHFCKFSRIPKNLKRENFCPPFQAVPHSACDKDHVTKVNIQPCRPGFTIWHHHIIPMEISTRHF